MNKIVIFPTTPLKTIIKKLSPSFKVMSFDEKKRYITIRQLEKKSTQTFKLNPARTYILSEDNASLKIERIHVFKNRENQHFHPHYCLETGVISTVDPIPFINNFY